MNTKLKTTQNEKPIHLPRIKSDVKGRPIYSSKPTTTKRVLPSSSPNKNSIKSKNSASNKRMSKKAGIKSKTTSMATRNNFNTKIVANQKYKTKSEEVVHDKDSHKTIIFDKPRLGIDPPPSSTTIPHIFRNPEHDMISVVVPVQSTNIETTQPNKSNKKDDEIKNMIKQTADEAHQNSSPGSDGKKRQSVFFSEKQSSGDLSENHLDKFMTHISKGEIVSLKLQIEVKNAEGVSTITHGKKKHVINLHRSSQTNLKVDIDNITLQEQQNNESQTGSFQTIISDVFYQNQHGSPNVIILKCPCCDYQSSVEDTNSLPFYTKDGEKIVIVMPVNTMCDRYETAE